jgi:putative transposase
VLREQEAGLNTEDLCRKQAISKATFDAWKAEYGGLGVSEAKRLKTLEDENGRLKRLLAEAMLDNAVLKDLAAKSSNARSQAGGGGSCPGGARISRRRAC